MKVTKAQVLGYLGALQAEAMEEGQRIAVQEGNAGNRLQSIYAAASEGSVHVQIAQQAQVAAALVATWGRDEAEVSLATTLPNGWETQPEARANGVN